MIDQYLHYIEWDVQDGFARSLRLRQYPDVAPVLGGGLAPFLMVLLLESTGTSMAVSAYIAVLALGCVTRLRPIVAAEHTAQRA